MSQIHVADATELLAQLNSAKSDIMRCVALKFAPIEESLLNIISGVSPVVKQEEENCHAAAVSKKRVLSEIEPNLIPGMRIRVWQNKPGLCSSSEGVYYKNILDSFKSLLFCFHTYGVRRTIAVLDSENQPRSGSGQIRTGSGALWLTGDARLTP